MKGAHRLLALPLLALSLAFPARAQEAAPAPAEAAAEAPPDVPSGDARIEGRVLQGDADRPVPGVEVVLYALSPDGTPGVRHAKTDASGTYAFEGVSNAATVAYLVGARHQGIPVPGGRVQFAPGERRATADIRVAELTPDMRGVRIREQTLRLFREADGVRVEESFALELAGPEIAYVPAADRARKPPGLRATLPAGASDFRMPLGVIPEGLVRSGAALSYYGPFYPGMQDLMWAYRLGGGAQTPEGARFRFSLTPAPGAERVSVLVPDGFSGLEVEGLPNAGAAQDNGRAVTRFSAAKPSGPIAVALVAPPARIDPSAISVHEVQIQLHADDAAIAVEETHLVAVGGDGLVLGTLETPLLRVPIPSDASDVRFGSEAQGLEFAAHPGGGVAVLGSLSPGEVAVQIAYRVPVAADGARLTRSFGVRVPLLRVFLADTGRVIPSSPRLHRARSIRTEDLNYLALEAFDVAAGEDVALALEPLPPRGAASPTAARAVAAALGLAVLAWIVWPFSRRGVPAADAEPDEPGRNEREAIYDAIRDLDHDFETAKVSAEDHTRLRESLRARAATLIQSEASGARAGAAPSAPRVCGQCGATAAAEHRFCAACGAGLGSPAA